MKCFLRAAEVAHGTSNFVDLAGARAMLVAEVACLVGLFGPRYAASVARATCLRPIPENGRLDGFTARVSNEAKAIKVTRTTPSSLKKYLESPVFGPRPRLVAVGSAAALAEASMAAAVEQAAARLADLKRKAAFFDAAVVGDPLALGRAMAAPSGDPVREGMIARNLVDESAIRQQRFAESLEERSMLAAQDELELSAALEFSVGAGGAGLLGEDLAGEDLAGGGSGGGGPGGEEPGGGGPGGRGPGGALAGAAGGRARGARVRARRSTRLLGAGLEKKTPIYDAAIVLDPLTEGFAKGEGASSSRRRFIVCKIAQPRIVAAFSRRQYVLVIFKIKIYNIMNFIIISPLTELWSYTSYTPVLLVAGAAGASSSAREVRAFRELTRGEARGTRTRAIEVAVMAG